MLPDGTRSARLLDWIDRHKVSLTATVTFAATATVLTKMRFGSHDQMIEFIAQKGLMEEYIEKYPVIVK